MAVNRMGYPKRINQKGKEREPEEKKGWPLGCSSFKKREIFTNKDHLEFKSKHVLFAPGFTTLQLTLQPDLA